jgi:hypothetical protein
MMDANDLECAITDLRHLSFVCREMMESKLKHASPQPKVAGFTQIMLNSDELAGLLYLVGEVASQAKLLDERFIKALDEGRAGTNPCA